MATANNNKEEAKTKNPALEGTEKEELFEYQASGIKERKGKIPLWIWSVTLVLIVWGIYYLVTYWSKG